MNEPGTPPASEQQLLHLAGEHHRAGRVREAEELYRQVLLENPNHPDALHGVGIIAMQVNKPELAAAYLGRAAQVAPNVAVFQFNQGEAWMLIGDLQQATACYRQAIAIDPSRPEPHATLGVALARMQRFADAVTSLQKSIELGLDRAEVYQHLGNALLQIGNFPQAETSARKAVEKMPHSAECWQTLGEAIGNQDRAEEAVECFRKAISLKPDLAISHYALGMTLGRIGEVDEAIQLIQRAIALRPDFAEALTNLGTMLIGRRRLDEAIETLRKAVQLRPMHLDSHIELARALELAQRHQEAAEAFGEMLKLSPDNPNVKFHIAALSGKETPPAPPESLVQALFNKHAASFDEHLAELDYQVPKLLFEAVTAAGASKQSDVLDLGCGTGLCGEVFRPVARKLVGVDLSPAMIEKARERGVYDRLEVGEVTAALNAAANAYDLLVAGDVLCYLGDLSKVFSAAVSALRRNGLFAFSVESHEGERWLLRPSRRYAHNPQYIRIAAGEAGLEVNRLTPSVLRKEGGKDVNGLVVVLARRND